MICEYCKGNKTIPEQVLWSDGWGMTQRACPLCHGTGETGNHFELLQRLIAAESALAQTQVELDRVRTTIAVYLLQQEGKISSKAPREHSGTGLKLAPYPGPWGWEEKLAEEAAKAPRA